MLGRGALPEGYGPELDDCWAPPGRLAAETTAVYWLLLTFIIVVEEFSEAG